MNFPEQKSQPESRRSRTEISWKTLLVVLLLMISSFAVGRFSDQFAQALGLQKSSSKPTPSNLGVVVDNNVHPTVNSIPGYDGTPRPLAALKNPEGHQSDFVANELILVTDNQTAVNSFVQRWNGQALKSFIPAEHGLSSVGEHLVRVNAASADTSSLVADAERIYPDAAGNYTVSSADGLRLLSAATSEKVRGLNIGINWVAYGTQYRDRAINDAPNGPPPYCPLNPTYLPCDPSYSGGYSPNAFTWSFMSRGSAQNFGTAEAWRAMEIAGRLSNKVGVLFIDGGFVPDADFPTGWVSIGPLNTPGIGTCSGGTPCPYHGTGVVHAAMGVPDNGFGGAGPAGPVGIPIIISLSSYNVFDYLVSGLGGTPSLSSIPRIVSISASADVPDWLAWTLGPVDLIVKGVRALGILIFSAAGNDSKSLDTQNCLVIFGWTVSCWDREVTIPCEFSAVICIGAIDYNSRSIVGYSNWGSAVRLYGPGSVFVAPDSEFRQHYGGYPLQFFTGTSAATPYVAGAAALVWAANPRLSADGVEGCLFSTAGAGLPPVTAIPNVYLAVICSMGNTPPEITITRPSDGAYLYYRSSVVFQATATDAEDSVLGRLSVVWTDVFDGNPAVAIGTGTSFVRSDLRLGTHVITATATDSGGFRNSDSITITITNNLPPRCAITAPSSDFSSSYDGFDVSKGRWFKDVAFQASCTDPENDPLTLVWITNQTAIQSPELGRGLGPLTVRLYGGTVRTQEVDHRITFVATDTSGNVNLNSRLIVLYDLV